jgi:hydrogenase maturation protease
VSGVLVIGIGNRWRSDDAVGLAVARALAGTEWEGEPMGLLDLWDSAEEVWLVDAVSSGSSPGAVHRVDATDEPVDAEVFQTSTHTVSVAETIELARALGRLPSRIVVYGIEGVNFAAGEGLSPEVAAAVPRVVQALREEVEACTRRS